MWACFQDSTPSNLPTTHLTISQASGFILSSHINQEEEKNVCDNYTDYQPKDCLIEWKVQKQNHRSPLSLSDFWYYIADSKNNVEPKKYLYLALHK